MLTEDGDWPSWDNEQPLPPGTEVIAFLRWDAAGQTFFLGKRRNRPDRRADPPRFSDRNARVN